MHGKAADDVENSSFFSTERRPRVELVVEPTGRCDVVVVGMGKRAGQPVLLGPDELAGTSLWAGLLDSGATGDRGQIVRIPAGGQMKARSVLAVGFGEVGERVTADEVRHASGCAARALAGCARVATTMTALDVTAAVEGLTLGSAVPLSRSTRPAPSAVEFVEGIVGQIDPADRMRAELAVDVAVAVGIARDLVNTPPNELSPPAFAERVTAMAKSLHLEVEVLEEDELATAGFGGIIGVGQGSERPPRLVRIAHRGAQHPVVALVGKGITFDSGGISIKPAIGMWNMTSDMAGAAAVAATVLLAAWRKLPITVIATLPLAENLPSGSAQRPGDVLTQYGGRTVHVLNTDAEGRLVLADAIVRACEDKPDYLIDVATLTGAQMVALGPRMPGVMGTDQFRDLVARLSQQVGENAWPMPLPDHLVDDLRSDLADIANVTDHRWAGMLAAGVFLRPFVDPAVAWAHLDIAGPGYNRDDAYGYTPHGGTGVPVRTLFAVLAHLAGAAAPDAPDAAGDHAD
ncbi:leucyl aminopeptidase [Amycolatopsis anabasis]|uniref:leucyl aminopeptidase n=1 Tax=Amycolatopsis anabasis TaxID=1840409 RepID=UPI00131BD4D5|nr:leucyl aminopeptidase [Amycolatopsis anabasis]